MQEELKSRNRTTDQECSLKRQRVLPPPNSLRCFEQDLFVGEPIKKANKRVSTNDK